MPIFPDIQYVNGLQPLPGERFAWTMVRKLGELQLVDQTDYPDYNMIHLENDINQRINNYNGTDQELELIFHRIQIWGGNHGRYIYVRGGQYFTHNKQHVINEYRNLVNTCLHIHDTSNESRQAMYDAIVAFNDNVKYIGVSFITKHTRFWLQQSLGIQALPIYDDTMAQEIMGCNEARIEGILPYWDAMIQQANSVNVDLVSLERQLFAHFKES